MNIDRRTLLTGLAALGLTMATGARAQSAPRQTIYGSQLMTRRERYEYRQKMRAAKTQEERERIRAEHHTAMQERARERGVTLPDMPPARGPGFGAGRGPGAGMGPGGGMGPGPGAGPGAGPGGGRP